MTLLVVLTCAAEASAERFAFRLLDWTGGARGAFRQQIVDFFKLDVAHLPTLESLPDGLCVANHAGAPAAVAWSPLDLHEAGVYTLRFAARFTGEKPRARVSAALGPARGDFEVGEGWAAHAVTMRQTGPVGPSSIAFSLRARKGRLELRDVELVRLPFDLRVSAVENRLRLEVVGKMSSEAVFAWHAGETRGQTRMGDLAWAPRDGVAVAALPLPPGELLWWRVSQGSATVLEGDPVRIRPLPGLPRRFGAAVQITRDGVTHIGGAPFLPIGLYLHESSVQAIERAAESGVNLVLMPPGDNPHALAAAAAAHGMQVIFETDVAPDPAQASVGVKTLVDRYGGLHPLAWTAVDEPDMKPAFTQRALEAIHLAFAACDGRPLYQANHAPSTFPTLGTACDILAVDPYPLGAVPKPVSTVGHWVDLAREALGPGRAVWLIQQAFVEAPLWPVPPTPEQLRAMTWVGLSHGARGVVYYTVHESLDPAASDHAWDLRRTPLWGEIRREADEMRALAAFLTASSGARPLGLVQPLDGAWWDDGGGNVLMAVVNISNAPHAGRVRLPFADLREVRVVPAGVGVEVVGGEVEFQLTPCGVLLLTAKRG